MKHFILKKDEEGRHYVEVPYRKSNLLHLPIYNKGTCFDEEERSLFGLNGLLPQTVSTPEEQISRAYQNIIRSHSPLARYIALAALQDRNEHLFYMVLNRYIEKLLPIVYTPTVGRACQEYSHIFRRGRGLWITPGHKGQIKKVLANTPFSDIRLIVVTDNERILGLGDQGAGGMGIPIGKLALYTAAAGIHPTSTLPISLDVGTDNEHLLNDPLYLGYRHARLRGPGYLEFVDEFVEAVREVFPQALLQWEDFKKGNAFKLLDRHKDQITSFNDDIQGTAAVATAGVMASARISGIPLTQQRIVIAGAGAAGIGIARQLQKTMELQGLKGRALTEAIALVDTAGMLVDNRPIPDEYKRPFAWPAELAQTYDLAGENHSFAEVVEKLKPTALIGVTGIHGYITEKIVRNMAAHVARPIIFPFSNPTANSEATPEDLLNWTDGRALITTGSPFPPVTCQGKTYHIGQGNNVFIFPGVGLGALASESTRVNDEMFIAAAATLASMVSDKDLKLGRLFPSVSELRHVAREVAIEVVRTARETGVGRAIADEEIPNLIDNLMWKPEYPRFVPV